MKTIKFLALVVITISLASCNKNGITKKSLKTEIDSVSYAAGLDMSYKIQQGFDEVDSELFIQGYRNGIDSTNLLLEQKDLQKIMSTYFRKRQQEKAKEKAAEGEKTKIEGEKFLEENKTKDGVITTESGLQYIVLKEGTGAKPKLTDKVKVHYHGTLIDGTVFDSSVDKGKPFETIVTQVVKGWVETLQLMNVGSKYKIFVPQELAYGANPRSGVIKPFMPLIFEIELLEIIK